MNLIWTDQVELPITRPKSRTDDLRHEQRSRPLLFVTGKPKATRKTKRQKRHTPGTAAFKLTALVPPDSNSERISGDSLNGGNPVAPYLHGCYEQVTDGDRMLGIDESSAFESYVTDAVDSPSASFDPYGDVRTSVSDVYSHEPNGDTIDPPDSLSYTSPVQRSFPDLTTLLVTDFPSSLLSQGVQFHNTAHQAGAILEMYDREFCVLPLTMDVQHNPFRVRSDSCEASSYLLHAVLAISAQHLAKKHCITQLLGEAQNHQALAVHHFRKALDHTPASRLLDTLLILVNFEATQTASSAWIVHLSGARRLLEVMGTAQACHSSPKARAQIAMLVWWDVTLACISRRQMSLPISYIEILRDYDGVDGWTFFALNGCPIELVFHMARLAKLASIYEQVIDLEHTTFQDGAVASIVDTVRFWNNPEDPTLEEIGVDSSNVASRRHRYHCIEAWRNGILLYCYRVFHRPADAAHVRVITHLAHLVLDHIRCIPRTEIVQKQVLLPLFLAAAEAEDETTRDFARTYCAYWNLGRLGCIDEK
ncbi:hypothetical protein LTR56_011027 [Elasticomyces elasticus]|nr:hypothetical protein LTR56_011027 [Elasticomyces elasticus]KAK3654995.1 hypothetical protein LTR22_010462 [Elasticomyces elasticus]KAK4914040.1 hypothetical protein LTR49_017656 [Elasticomyces elasticus]KAK5757479.1 hypothetical protein LTS12_012437 [Elasticomyces elasticus]